MKPKIILPLIILPLLAGCVAVPFAGDRVTVKAKDTTVLVLVDLDLLSSPEALRLCASARDKIAPEQKAPYLPSERVSLKNAPSHGAIPANENATAFRGFAKGVNSAADINHDPWAEFLGSEIGNLKSEIISEVSP